MFKQVKPRSLFESVSRPLRIVNPAAPLSNRVCESSIAGFGFLYPQATRQLNPITREHGSQPHASVRESPFLELLMIQREAQTTSRVELTLMEVAFMAGPKTWPIDYRRDGICRMAKQLYELILLLQVHLLSPVSSADSLRSRIRELSVIHPRTMFNQAPAVCRLV